MPTINVRWADNTEALKKNLKEGTQSIEATRASVEKLAQSLSGEKLIASAHRMAAAIQQVGGVAKLTAAEQQRANALFEKAAEKLNLAGKGSTYAAQTFRDLATATKHAADAADQSNQLHSKLFESLRLNVPIVSGLSARVTENVAALGGLGIAVGGAAVGYELFTKAIRPVGEIIASSIKAYAEAEAAQSKLTAALKTAGLAAPEVKNQYNDLASEFQRTTVFSAGLVTEMQALLTQVGGVMPGDMQAALKASTDLAAGLGIDLQSATNLVAKAAAGHTEALGKYGIQVSDAALASKGFSAVLEGINRQFGGSAAAQIETYAGKVEQIKNAWNNVQEALGKLILTNPLVEETLRKTADAANELDQRSGNVGLSIGGVLRAMSGIPGIDLTPFAAIVTKFEQWADAANEVANATERILDLGPPKDFLPAPIGQPQSPAQAAAGLPDATKIAFAMQEVAQQADRLTAAQQRAALAAFNHGQSVEQATKLLEQYWPEVSKSQVALTNLHREWEQGQEKAKKLAEATREIESALGGFGAIVASIDPLVAAEATNLLKLGVSQEAIATKYNLTAVQVKALTAAEALRVRIVELEIGANAGLAESLSKIGKVDTETIAQLKSRLALEDKLAANERAGLPSFAGDLEKIGRIEKQLTFDEMVRGLSTSQRIAFSIHESLADLPNLLIQAFTGGGNLAGALKGLATKLSAGLFGGEGDKAGPLAGITQKVTSVVTGATSFLGKTISSILGSTIGGFLPGLGGLIAAGVGKLITAIKNIGGPSEAELAGRKAAASFEKGIADGLTAAQKAEAGTDAWKMTVIGVRDAYLATGRSAQQAEADVARLWAAEKKGAEAVAKVQAEIQAVFDEIKKNSDALAALKPGEFLSADLKKFIDAQLKSGQATEAVTNFIKAQGEAAIQAGNDIIAGEIEPQLAGWDAIKKAIEDADAAWDAAKKAGDVSGMRKADQERLDATKKQREAAAGFKQELQDLGTIALATFGAAIASGKSFAEALQAAGPGLQQLGKAFEDLGIPIEDAGLKALVLQSTLLQNNPKLIQGVSGLGNAFAALSNLGLLNVETFQAMQRTGIAMYTRIQGEVAKTGGSTRDALLPMQDYLHKAQEAAEQLGVPLDENTQILIAQSKELGIWKEKGLSSTEKLTAGMQSLIDKLNEFLDRLAGIPPKVTTEFETKYTSSGERPPPGQTTEDQNNPEASTASSGGIVTNAGILAAHFAKGGIVSRDLPRLPIYLGEGGPVSFIPRGTDVVPAMLTPGEEVLSIAQRHELAGELRAGSDMAATLKDLLARIALPGADTQGQVLKRLDDIRNLLAMPKDTVVQISGETIVRATNRVYDDNAAGLRTRAQDLLGIERP